VDERIGMCARTVMGDLIMKLIYSGRLSLPDQSLSRDASDGFAGKEQAWTAEF
jgi:hypothetical protein